MNLIQQTLQFIADPQNTFWQHTLTFLYLCVVSIVAATVIAVPIGVAVYRKPTTIVVLAKLQPVYAFLFVNLAGLGRAVPTLVFLALVIPYLGIGVLPSVVALTLIGLPPILLNTIAALQGIDPAAVDAARGMGMSPWQLLTRVQLPLALPILAAGIRTTAVQVIATAPIAGFVGGGGYGDYIFQGIGLLQTPPLLAGAVPVAVLALIAEYGLAAVERAITPAGVRPPERQRRRYPSRPTTPVKTQEPAQVA